MKVVLLAQTPPPHGGIAGWTERMLKARLKNGWEVVVVDEKTAFFYNIATFAADCRTS